jgi:hypothetical protein
MSEIFWGEKHPPCILVDLVKFLHFEKKCHRRLSTLPTSKNFCAKRLPSEKRTDCNRQSPSMSVIPSLLLLPSKNLDPHHGDAYMLEHGLLALGGNMKGGRNPLSILVYHKPSSILSPADLPARSTIKVFPRGRYTIPINSTRYIGTKEQWCPARFKKRSSHANSRAQFEVT